MMLLALAVAVALVWAVHPLRAVHVRRPTAHRPAPEAQLRLGLLVRIGLSAGLSTTAALAASRDHVDPRTASAVDDVLREGMMAGLAHALLNRDEAQLFQVLAHVQASGAPAAAAVSAFVADEADRLRAAATERAKTLPIRLTLPVALCLLPGFVLLAVAPQLVLALRQLAAQVGGL